MVTRSSKKKIVLVTGSEGFIGKNLVAQLQFIDGLEIRKLNRHNSIDIQELCRGVNFVFHFAGENRPENPRDFMETNVGLTRKLLKILESEDDAVPIVFTSSTQAGKESLYGKSKYQAEEDIREYSEKTNSPIYIYRLPNVFGKWAKPNYNSVVATFCYNVSNDLPLQINNPDFMVTLVHIDDVVKSFINLLNQTSPSENRICSISPTKKISVGELAKTLQEFWDSRISKVIPDLSTHFNKALYGTLTSYYELDNLSVKPELFSDERGWLFELVKSKTSGQIFVSSTNPGYTRGDHWHHTKVEKFTVIKGSGTLLFRHVSSEEIISFTLSDKEIEIYDVPVGYIHTILNNTNEQMILLIWASEILDKNNPDTLYEKVVL